MIHWLKPHATVPLKTFLTYVLIINAKRVQCNTLKQKKAIAKYTPSDHHIILRSTAMRIRSAMFSAPDLE